ncbi:VCBS domain-containing protein, partial [Massilia terrae]
GAVGEDGVQSASGTLTVSDVDIGEAVFKDPASLHGTYGDFSFNSATGAWSYTLRNGDAYVQALNAGKVVADEITVTSSDGTASAKLHVDVTGANDAASISGNGNGAVAEDGVLAASGKLAVTDPDSGEAAFKAPATLAGIYGDFSFNTSTGDWSYLLRNGDANVQALSAGKVVADEITVTSLDRSASTKLHVDITGANDKATIGGTSTGAVSEDNVLSASGTLTVTDPDSGEASFQAPNAAALTGTYGNFTFDKATGAWTYALRNADSNVQALNSGQVVSDKLVVSSFDGSSSSTITVNVAGADEPNPVTIFQANHGQTDINGKVVFSGFDYNDQLVYASNYTYSGYTVSDYNGDGKQDSIVHLTYTSNGGKADLYVVLLGISTLAPGQVHVST